jgi:hypothetical protein
MKTILTLVVCVACYATAIATPKNAFFNPTTPFINHRANMEELLQDGVLKITIAVGFTDEEQLNANAVENIHELNVQKMRQWFQKKNWQHTSTWGYSLAKEVYQGGQTVRYIDEKGVHDQLIWVECELLLPKSESLTFFTQALNDAEILVYMGHGRFGLGPDFDPIDSDKGNFLIGAYSELHRAGKVNLPEVRVSSRVMVTEKNALEASLKEDVWKSEHYRLWFFNACNSQFYGDELRSPLLPANIRSTKNMDLLLSEGLVALYAGSATTICYMETIFKGSDMESLPEKLYNVQQETLIQSKQYYDNVIESYNAVYKWQGIQDNPLYYAQPPVKKKGQISMK